MSIFPESARVSTVEEKSDPQEQRCSEEAEMTQMIHPKERDRERAHHSQRHRVRWEQHEKQPLCSRTRRER